MPQAVVQNPSFSTKAPDVLNIGQTFSFSLPVLNIGQVLASNIVISDIDFGPAARVGPVLPLSLGDLAVDNVLAVNGLFSAGDLVVGQRYLATIRGTYGVGDATYGLVLNRYITVPPAISSPVALLAAHISLVFDPLAKTWTYKVFNDEDNGSPRFINAISLDVNAPFLVTGTPVGWGVDTDNLSFVLWRALDQVIPYPHHIPPGRSLGGFQIQSPADGSTSMGFVTTSWNHQTDQADLVAPGSALAPSQT